jgi:hypothetical protein
VDIAEELNWEYDDPVDDSDLDPDYRDSEASGESSEEEEEQACTSTPAVTGWRRRERPKEHTLVYVDPPIERADGDTDMDSGTFLKTIFNNCDEWYSNIKILVSWTHSKTKKEKTC